MRWILLVAVAGCSYTPGSYAYPGRTFAGQRLAAGCLDVAIDRRADIDGRPVIDYQFGNRCDESVKVDLAHVPVVGRTATGNEITLTPWDPRREIVAARIGARQAGGEAIAYLTDEPIVQVCADVAGLDGRAVSIVQWVCFGNRSAIAAVTP